jgi:hypothetical protein
MLIALLRANRLIKKLLEALLGLDAAEELPSHCGSSCKSLFEDINFYRIVLKPKVLMEGLLKEMNDGIT